MPKISDERRAERLEQILEGARRCFAENGYEGATVAKLEHTIGLSRGAIFNYYPSKEDLFLDLCLVGSGLQFDDEAVCFSVDLMTQRVLGNKGQGIGQLTHEFFSDAFQRDGYRGHFSTLQSVVSRQNRRSD